MIVDVYRSCLCKHFLVVFFFFQTSENGFDLVDLMQEVNHFCTVCADCSQNAHVCCSAMNP